MQLKILDADLIQTQPDPLGRLIQRQLIELVQIAGQQHQNALAVHHELPAILADPSPLGQGDGRVQVAGRHGLEPFMDQPHPGRPIQAAILGLQHDDGLMEQDQGL
ncbi:hypothetical protein D3C80_843160 [compost metagenome]